MFNGQIPGPELMKRPLNGFFIHLISPLPNTGTNDLYFIKY